MIELSNVVVMFFLPGQFDIAEINEALRRAFCEPTQWEEEQAFIRVFHPYLLTQASLGSNLKVGWSDKWAVYTGRFRRFPLQRFSEELFFIMPVQARMSTWWTTLPGSADKLFPDGLPLGSSPLPQNSETAVL